MGTGHEGEGQELCSHWSLGRVLILFGGMGPFPSRVFSLVSPCQPLVHSTV